MIARGAERGPWLLADVLAGTDQGRRPPIEVVTELRALVSLAAADMGAHRAARWSRKIAGRYLRGLGFAQEDLDRLRAAPDAAAVDAALAALIAG